MLLHGLGLCEDDSEGDNVAFCLRPVVSLSSSIPAEKIEKITNQVTESWDDPFGIYQGS